MDVFQAVSGYVTKMVSTGDGQAGSNAAKMKILLLDNETVTINALKSYHSDLHTLMPSKVPIVSSATTQSALLNHEVYLTECVLVYSTLYRPIADYVLESPR